MNQQLKPLRFDPPSSNNVFKKGEYLELDHGKRTPILNYHPNDQDDVRIAYLVNGPTRPNMTEYPPRKIGKMNRSLNNSWHKDNDWLEYSIEKEVVFCLPCYLYYNGTSNSAFLNTHAGELNSHQRNCVKACANLMKKNQSIGSSFVKHSTKAEADYLVHVKASLEAVKFLVRGGIVFMTHNEGENSIYKGHFLEFIDALGRNRNCKMTSPVIQKELANTCAVETDTSAKALKDAHETLLSGFGLSSNMKDQFGGLKTLIQKENPQAYYVHCFAHQFQLALVSMARKHEDVDWLFLEVSHSDEFVKTGTGLFQEFSVARASDTRWGSHFRTLSRLVDLFTPIIEVLEDLKSDRYSKGEPKSLLLVMQTFGFVFMLHLMVEVLSLTNDLSQAFQKGDQDIVTAMQLVQVSKKRLQQMRDNGRESFYEKVVDSCSNLEINVPDMESRYVKGNKSKRLAPLLTNLNYFKNDCFIHVIDFVMKELGDRFTPKNIELLNCVACLNPYSSFQDFDIKSLVRLAKFYANDFEDVSDKEMSSQLETSIECDISDLCRTLVRTKKHQTFGLVYTLLKLALSLPVATSIDDLDIIKSFQAMSRRRMHLRLD
ncbi:hypothetical protein ABFS83_04G136000 [Erythranthe nasuta]